MKMTEQEILYDKIVEYQEEIANLRAEILELKVEYDDESEPYHYANEIIENYDLDQIEEKIKWLQEVSEYLEVYIGYHRTEDVEED